MVRDLPGWQTRVARAATAVEWIALAIGTVVSIVTSDAEPPVFVASGLAGLWVLMTTTVQLSVLRRPIALDAFSLGGVILTMLALTITGGGSSPFFLLSLTPPIRAALLGGYRPGLASGLLSALLLLAASLAADGDLGLAIGLGCLYLAIAATVAQVRRILVDLQEQAESAERSSGQIARRLDHLESANQLLSRLAELASASDLNPIAIGRAALESVGSRYPGCSAVAALEGSSGPILVAKHGTAFEGGYSTQIPLEVQGAQVGFVRLTTADPIDELEAEGLQTALRPMALAFANARLLQDISTSAIKEERTRLARELHDDIGPSLASLGMSLDAVLVHGIDQSELTGHLQGLRRRVGELVEEVRSTVTDLRLPASSSLKAFLNDLASDLPDMPPLVHDVHERRPIRPSLAQDIYGIIGEAVRNATHHSSGSRVSVGGWIDFDRGNITIEDNGIGFDTLTTRDGHYGLLGMRERADRVGATIDIQSSSGGSRVRVVWGDR